MGFTLVCNNCHKETIIKPETSKDDDYRKEPIDLNINWINNYDSSEGQRLSLCCDCGNWSDVEDE